MVILIDQIECGGLGACQGTTFITGPNVEIREVHRATDSCLGCLIKLNANDPGRPCDPTVPFNPNPQPPLNPITQPPRQLTLKPQTPPPTPQPTPAPTDSMYIPIPGGGQWMQV